MDLSHLLLRLHQTHILLVSVQLVDGNQQQQQPKYYNTSAFPVSGTYGPLVRPPSPPIQRQQPPLAQAEYDDDIDTMGSGNKDSLSPHETSAKAVEGIGQPLKPDDYLEPRVKGMFYELP